MISLGITPAQYAEHLQNELVKKGLIPEPQVKEIKDNTPQRKKRSELENSQHRPLVKKQRVDDSHDTNQPKDSHIAKKPAPVSTEPLISATQPVNSALHKEADVDVQKNSPPKVSDAISTEKECDFPVVSETSKDITSDLTDTAVAKEPNVAQETTSLSCQDQKNEKDTIQSPNSNPESKPLEAKPSDTKPNTPTLNSKVKSTAEVPVSPKKPLVKSTHPKPQQPIPSAQPTSEIYNKDEKTRK